jgi:uncharacterized protein YbjT (DUF2867 family)
MEIKKAHKTAILLGATGLVGGYVLQFLLENEAYEKVVALTRRPLSIRHQKLENVVLDFEQLLDYQSVIKGDDLFLCLGTTIKKAGSQEAFKRIDVDYQMQAAIMAKRNGMNQVMLCSAVDADSKSRIFYNRMKGDLEDSLKGLGFWSVHIFQPSILLGERNENRFGERIAQILGRGLDKIVGGLLSKYRPVEGEVVARAMVNSAQILTGGVCVYPSHELSKT